MRSFQIYVPFSILLMLNACADGKWAWEQNNTSKPSSATVSAQGGPNAYGTVSSDALAQKSLTIAAIKAQIQTCLVSDKNSLFNSIQTLLSASQDSFSATPVQSTQLTLVRQKPEAAFPAFLDIQLQLSEPIPAGSNATSTQILSMGTTLQDKLFFNLDFSLTKRHFSLSSVQPFLYFIVDKNVQDPQGDPLSGEIAEDTRIVSGFKILAHSQVVQIGHIDFINKKGDKTKLFLDSAALVNCIEKGLAK